MCDAGLSGWGLGVCVRMGYSTPVCINCYIITVSGLMKFSDKIMVELMAVKITTQKKSVRIRLKIYRINSNSSDSHEPSNLKPKGFKIHYKLRT